jgi:hypothetical protein
MATIGTVNKQPYEEFNVTVDFSNVLSDSETLSTATVAITLQGTNSDQSDTMAGTPSIVGDTVVCLIKAGADGSKYNASYRVVTSESQKFEADVLVLVVETS